MMRRTRRIALVAGSTAVIGLFVLGFRILDTAGIFSDVTPAFDGTCQTVRGVVGAEDIAVDRESGMAFLSATDRHAPKDHANTQDGIYIVQPAHPERGVTKLAGVPKDFHPHGIGLYRAPNGMLTLMAVNHRSSGISSVDIFTVHETRNADGTAGASLSEVTSIESSLLVRPNDVAPTGPDSFYVTNGHTSVTAIGRFLETWLFFPRANVIYFDGQVPRVVAKGLRFANGVALSPDGGKLYVAESLGRDIVTYSRKPLSGGLEQENIFSIPSGLDNIDVDANGDLWVAGHPKLFAYVKYGKDPTKPSPSVVYKVTVQQGIPKSSQAVFTDLGKELGASSVGVWANGKLLIGSVYDSKFLECTPR